MMTPMSGFWIPNLGGMLYAMTGHINNLNLMAEKPGDYPGSTSEINGAGMADMKFTARATSQEDFDNWVQGTQYSPDVLIKRNTTASCSRAKPTRR
jgi:cytochrome o ubiquinol oxidase subunit 2